MQSQPENDNPNMNPLVPPELEPHFEAMRQAHTLSITSLDIGRSWLDMRILGYWLRQSRNGNDVGICLFSVKHPFDYYAEKLSSFGIDVRQCESKGSLCFIGDFHNSLLGQNPQRVLEDTIESIGDAGNELRTDHDRTVLIMDSPELCAPFIGGDMLDAAPIFSERLEKLAAKFDNTVVLMRKTFPTEDRNEKEFLEYIATTRTAEHFTDESAMSITLQSHGGPTPELDGTIRISYNDNFVAMDGSPDTREKGHPFKVMPDGRTVHLGPNYIIGDL